MISELKSDLRDTVDWGRKWLVDFNAAKAQIVLFDRSNNTGAIDVKMNGSVLKENSSFKMVGLTFSSKLDWSSYIIYIAKTVSKKIGVLICSINFFLLRLLCISINLTYTWSYHTLVVVLLNWLNWYHFLFLEGGLLAAILIDCMIFLSSFQDVTRMSMSTVFFLVQPDSGVLCL